MFEMRSRTKSMKMYVYYWDLLSGISIRKVCSNEVHFSSMLHVMDWLIIYFDEGTQSHKGLSPHLNIPS